MKHGAAIWLAIVNWHNLTTACPLTRLLVVRHDELELHSFMAIWAALQLRLQKSILNHVINAHYLGGGIGAYRPVPLAWA